MKLNASSVCTLLPIKRSFLFLFSYQFHKAVLNQEIERKWSCIFYVSDNHLYIWVFDSLSLVSIGRVFNLLFAGEPCFIRERPCQSKKLPYQICVAKKVKWNVVLDMWRTSSRWQGKRKSLIDVSGLEYCIKQFVSLFPQSFVAVL